MDSEVVESCDEFQELGSVVRGCWEVREEEMDGWVEILDAFLGSGEEERGSELY